MQRALVQKTSEGHHHVWKEAPVRVWIDTVFYSPGETDILRDTLNNTAGMMVGVPTMPCGLRRMVTGLQTSQ